MRNKECVSCLIKGCGRIFPTKEKLKSHLLRRHEEIATYFLKKPS